MKKDLSKEVVEHRQERKKAKKKRQKQRQIEKLFKKVVVHLALVVVSSFLPAIFGVEAFYIYDTDRLKEVESFKTTISNVRYDEYFSVAGKSKNSYPFVVFDTNRGNYCFFGRSDLNKDASKDEKVQQRRNSIEIFKEWERTEKELTIKVSPIKDRSYYSIYGGRLEVMEIKDESTVYFSSDYYFDNIEVSHDSSVKFFCASLAFVVFFVVFFVLVFR